MALLLQLTLVFIRKILLHGFQREHQVQEIFMELGNRIVSPAFMNSLSFQRINIFSAVALLQYDIL